MRSLAFIILLTLPTLAFGQQPTCARPVIIDRTGLTDSHAVLARALNILQRDRHRSDMLRRSVEREQFCADSASFLERWSSLILGPLCCRWDPIRISLTLWGT